jgi:hypothetical protein
VLAVLLAVLLTRFAQARDRAAHPARASLPLQTAP